MRNRGPLGGNLWLHRSKRSPCCNPVEEWCRRLSSLRASGEHSNGESEGLEVEPSSYLADDEPVTGQALPVVSHRYYSRTRFQQTDPKYVDFVHSTLRERDGWRLDPCWNPAWVISEDAATLQQGQHVAVGSEAYLGLDPVRVENSEDCIELWMKWWEDGGVAGACQVSEATTRRVFVAREILYHMLKGCMARHDLFLGRRIHALAVSSGYGTDSVFANQLIRMYTSHGSLGEASQVFDNLPAPNQFVWASIIGAHAELGEAKEAVRLYERMKQTGVEPNQYILVAVLQACAGAGDLSAGKWVHADVMDSGLESNLFVGSTLVDMYAKCGSLQDARRVFDGLSTRNVVTWSAIITAYAQHGLGQEALDLYKQMQQDGIAAANRVTFLGILKACSKVGAIHEAKQIHSEILGRGLEADVFIGSCLVDMYAKCGSLDDARRVFDRLSTRNLVTWNAMVAGYATQGLGQEALKLYLQMEQNGLLLPNEVTFVSILKACSGIGAIQQGKRIHSQILERGLEADMFVGSTLVDMYGKCGELEDARNVFENVSSKNVVTWNALINAYGQHNECGMAIQCFEEMKRAGVVPDASTFVGLLMACSHVGWVPEGQRYFALMTQEHRIRPEIEHYTCMVDLLARAGHLAEAERMLQTEPHTHDTVGWISLLHACKMFGNVDLGKRCFDRLVELDPRHSSGYTIMSNIYTDAGRWADAESIKSLRKSAGAEKKAARAFIEVNYRVHEFVVGQERGDTVAKLTSLNCQTKEEKTDHAESTGTEDEGALCGHAEKLALAFGLLNTPEGTTLLVVKNLRMCNHCHSGTKLLSRVEKREIIVRDAHRVHRFTNGVCSCRDHR